MRSLTRFLTLGAFGLALCAPATATPLSDVTNAMLALGHAKTFHVAITSHGQAAAVDVVQPGRAHLVYGPFEVITIDGTTYAKIGGGWHQYAIPGIGRITSLYESAIRKASRPTDQMTVVDLGLKTVDGAVLHAYTFKRKDESVPTTLYIDAKGLPAQIDADDGTSIRISDINGPITIDAPPM